MPKEKNYNYTFVPTNKQPGIIKRPYLKCAGCGNKMYFETVVGPDDRFSLFVVNKRGTEHDKLQLVCGKCDKITVLGLERGANIKDN
jgi:hypothetical protein